MPRRKPTAIITVLHTPPAPNGGEFSTTYTARALKAIAATVPGKDDPRAHLRAVYVYPAGYAWATDGHRALLAGPGLPATGAAMREHRDQHIAIAPDDIARALKLAGARGTIRVSATVRDQPVTLAAVSADGSPQGEITARPLDVQPPPLDPIVAQCDDRLTDDAAPSAPKWAANPQYIVAAAEAMTAIGASTMVVRPGPSEMDPILVSGESPDGRALAIVMPMRV